MLFVFVIDTRTHTHRVGAGYKFVLASYLMPGVRRTLVIPLSVSVCHQRDAHPVRSINFRCCVCERVCYMCVCVRATLSVKLCAHLFIVGANSPGQKCGKNNETATTMSTKNDIKIVALTKEASRQPTADSQPAMTAIISAFVSVCVCVFVFV